MTLPWIKRGSGPAAFSLPAPADLGALAILAALTLLFFWPAVVGQAWVPRGGGDLVSFLWPSYAFAARALRSGHIPLWNPYLYSGAPFAADNQSGLFYPINLLAFFLLPMTSYGSMEALVFLHFWLAGAGLYAAARMEGLGRWPALAGGTAFMFSDVFVTHIGNLNIVAVSAWLPLVLACLRRGLRRRSPGWCAASGGLLGMAALAGHAQMTLILACAAGLYGAWELAAQVAGGERRGLAPRARQGGVVIALLGLWVVVAGGVSAISTLPSLELTGQTARARLEYSQASRYSLPPAGLAGLISPLVFGRGPAEFWGPWERVETGYAGALTLLLAAAAFLPAPGQAGRSPGLPSAPHADRRRLALFLAALFAFGLLVALGQFTPVHAWLYRLVPGFAQLRVPARFILLSDYSLSLLAALGLHRAMTLAATRRGLLWATGLLAAGGALGLLLAYGLTTQAMPGAAAQHQTGLIRGMVLYVAALAAGGLLLDRLRLSRLPVANPRALPPARYRGALCLAACLVLAADLVSLGSQAEIEPNDPTLGYRHALAVAFLQAQPGPTRIDSATGQWQPDTALMHGLEDIGGISNPLALARYDAYYWSVGYRGSPQYNFLGAQFVVAEKGTPPADASFVPVYTDDPDVDLYLNTGARPRVSLVYHSLAARDGPGAFALIHAPGFDPAETVVIEGGPALPEGAAGGDSNLAYLEYGAERIVIQAAVPGPAYLVLAETWYPGWRARVDGRETPIYRANYAFRAVQLEAGEHRIEMTFEPWTWRAGVGITLLTVAALAAWAWRNTTANRRRTLSPNPSPAMRGRRGEGHNWSADD